MGGGRIGEYQLNIKTMGMESFNAVPEVPAEESERIDDKEKAEAMAHASKFEHDMAAGYKKVVSGETSIEKGRVPAGQKAKIVDLGTFDIAPNTAGNPGVDTVRRDLTQGFNRDMSDEEIKKESADRVKNHEFFASAEEDRAASRFGDSKKKESAE